MEKRLVITATRLQQKIHRLDLSILFIESCMEHRKTPRFAKMGKFIRKKLSKSHLNHGEVNKLEMESLRKELKNHRGKILNLQTEVNIIYEKIRINCKNLSNYENVMTGIRNRVVSLEANRDKNREKKLDK